MSVWMIETLLATTLLMAVVMLLRRPVAQWLGAGAAYWLWALPVARMILPAIPQDVAAPSPLHSAVDQVGLPDLVVSTSLSAGQIATPGAAPFPWLELAIGVWLAGAALFLAVQAIGYVRFRRLILKDAVLLAEEGRTRILASPRATGPLAFGILHPHIVMPADFETRFDTHEQEMALAHERAHHDHGDLAANMVALLLLGLHWCNPVAWIAYRAFRADQEQACDARVLALYGQDSAQAYGRAILKAAGGRPFAAACHLTPVTALKGRLKMLSNHELSLRRISWGMAAVGAVTLGGLALTASGSRAAREVAAITAHMPEMRLSRLSDLVVQDASAMTEARLTTPAEIAEPPLSPAPPTADVAMPTVPAVPAAPAVAAVDPVPPVPPLPPVAHSMHRIPSQTDIRRMVPDIDITDGCDDGKASHSETVDADGRKHVRVRICQQAIERQARRAALQGLMTARDSIRRSASLSDKVRAEVLAELEAEIADMRADRH